MTVTIDRHVRPRAVTPEILELLEETMVESIDRAERTPGALDFAFDEAMSLICARLDSDAPAMSIETWEAVVNAMQAGSALFATTTTAGGTVQCRINHEIRTIPRVGPQFYTDAANWLNAMWFAIICRDQARMTELCAVPVELLRAAEAQYDEYAYLWVDCLQTWWLRAPGLPEKLTRVIQLSHPDTATIAPRDMLQFILYQPINLFYNYVRHRVDGFAEALANALEYHKAYWSANDDRLASIEGNLALGPLAMACLAYDADFELGVESDYLPRYLLNRAWLGQFET